MDAKNMTVTDWAIDNGYDEIETYTSDEFVAWHAHEYDPAEMHGPTFTGVKAWRDPNAFDERFIAVKRHENGEQWGRRGVGCTMLQALQDL